MSPARPDRGVGASVLVVALLAVAIPLVVVSTRGAPPLDDPWAHVPAALPHTDHGPLMPGPYATGPEVTEACLACHEEEGHELLGTSHFTWESAPTLLPGRDTAVVLGKKHVINNFCISVESNWSGCSSCHAGYGWTDDRYDFTDPGTADCLVCHDGTGSYAKTNGGLPADGVDLAAVARSVGSPTRATCGSCHFSGGGGDAVKHGDLDGSLTNPRARLDVHMGEHAMECTDCHRTTDHDIRGRALSVSADGENQVACTDCHAAAPHADARLNDHLSAVACATCHVPQVALREATKTHWDWSQAGLDLPEDTHEYLKKKGRFEYEAELVPEYAWYDGRGDRYVMGDRIADEGPTALNPPLGSIDEADARIWPFKVHRGVQPADAVYRTLMVPRTVGPGGYWEVFDWDRALREGAAATGLPYSGEYAFVETTMHWPLAHMVQPASAALQCRDCHGETGRMDWAALGYPGDPAHWGGR